MRYEEKEGFVEYGEAADDIFDDDGNETTGETYILIDLVYIYPEHRRQGHARRILAAALEEIKKTGFQIKLAALPKEESIDQNDLVSFYESMGFSPSEVQGGAAVIMEL